MTTYCDREDAFIDRSDSYARLFNSDGDMLYAFPDSFTDDQVFKALSFANKTFAAGVRTLYNCPIDVEWLQGAPNA